MNQRIKKLFRPFIFLIAIVLLLNFFGYFFLKGNKGFYLHLNETIDVIESQKSFVQNIDPHTQKYNLYLDSLSFYNGALESISKDITVLAKDQHQVFLTNLLENYQNNFHLLVDALQHQQHLINEEKNNLLVAIDNLLYSFRFWSQDYYYSINHISLGKILSLCLSIVLLLILVIEPIIKNYRSNKSNLHLTKQELIKEKLFLKSILNSQTNFILRLNDHFQLNYVNPAFLKRFKYKSQNIPHLTIYDLVQPKDYYKCRQILEECIHHPQKVFSITLEIPIVGEEQFIWTSWDFINLSNEGEANTEIQVIGVDINEKYHAQKQTEETLRTKTFALTHAKMGSWKYDFMTRELTLSREMLLVLEIENKENLKIRLEDFISEFVPPKYHHKILNEVVKAISSKRYDRESSFSIEIVNRQNKKKWLYISGKFIDKTTCFGIAQDISNQKKSADALSESNFKFKLLADNAEDIIFTTDKKGRFTYISPSVEKALGYTPKEIQNKHFSSLIHYDDFEKVNWVEFLRAHKHSEPKTLRFKVVSKNQYYSWFECIIKPLNHDEDFQFICTARNITQRTIAETEREQLLEEIKQSEELFRTVINSTPDWMYIKDTGQRYLMVNTAYADNMQLSPAEFIGRTEFELNLPYPENHVFPNILADMEVLKSGIIKHNSSEQLTLGNREFVMSTTRIPLFSKDHSIWGVLCIAHNISDIKQEFKELVHKDRLLESLVQASQQLLKNHDIDLALKSSIQKLGDQLDVANIGIYAMNDQHSNEFIKSIYNWKGKQSNSFDKEENLPIPKGSAIFDTLNQKRSIQIWTTDLKDESLIAYTTGANISALTLIPLFVNNKHWGFLSISNQKHQLFTTAELSILESFTENIASALERKDLEQSIILVKNANELAASSKAEFITNSTNDLRTPLNSIINLTDIVLKSDIQKSQKEFLNSVKRSAEELQQMINNILDYSSLESGSLVLNHKEIIIEDFVSDIFNVYQLEAMDKNISLTTYVHPGLPSKIAGDDMRIKIIISHLLNNAFKFTAVDENVIIAIKPIGPITHQQGKAMQRIEIKVKDTGYGMTPKKLKLLTQFFQSKDHTGLVSNNGTGLGLSITKRLLDLMDGSISVESEMGKGATFRVKLDLEVLVPESPYSEDIHMNIQKALIVQKNKFASHYIKSTLEYFNIPTICCDNVEEAIYLLMEHDDIQLVIADQFIGNYSGIEFLQQISNDLKFPLHQCVLMLPALENDMFQQQAQNIGITNIISKPIKTYELFGWIYTASLPPTSNIQYPQKENKAMIMVVEDDEMNRMLIQKVLNGLGFDVIALSSGKDCLEQITINAPVLIFLDLSLPIMDGYTTARLIRKLKAPLCNIPIVAISGSTSLEDRQKCLDVSINDFIGKPYRYDDIVKVLKKRTLLV